MFLFVSEESRLPRPPKGIEGIGEVQTVRAKGSLLLWTNDPFTAVEQTSNSVVVRLSRPSIDREPVSEIIWNKDSGQIVCSRRWSGEFSAYYCDRPYLGLSSHIKLASAALKHPLPRWKRLQPGYRLEAKVPNYHKVHLTRQPSLVVPFDLDYEGTVREVRRLVLRSVASRGDNAALLLSGGIDSSVLAYAAQSQGRRVHAFSFSLEKLVRPQSDFESDLQCARTVASHLGIPLSEVLIPAARIIRNLPLALYLAETPRGTIVDDCTALIEVARLMAAKGFRQVWMGEAADDLFGGFKFALRYYRGAQLKAYYRRQLSVDLPNELATIQNVFAPFGISVIHPMWTSELLRIGYNLPLKFRLDRRRLMKQVLRSAFASDLPSEITNRIKCVTRDSTQIRFPLEQRFGVHRDRYRSLFRTILGERARWPRNLHRLLKRLKS